MDPNIKPGCEREGLEDKPNAARMIGVVQVEYRALTRRKHQQIQGGFTLVEILVAIAVLALIVALLASVNQTVMNGYLRIVNQSRQREEARSILLIMADEIHQALLPVDRFPSYGTPPTFLSGASTGTAFPTLDFLINPKRLLGLGGNPKPYANPHNIFWQYPIRDSSGTGGSALIGYAVQWQSSTDGSQWQAGSTGRPIPVLCRLRSNTGQLFQNINSSAVALQPWPAPGTTAPFLSMLTTFCPATPSSAYKGWMADYIIALWVRALDPLGNPITTSAPLISGMNKLNASTRGHSIIFGAAPSANNLVSSALSLYYFDSKLGYRWFPTYPDVTSTAATKAAIDRYPPALPASVEIAIVSVSPSALSRITTPLLVASPLGTDPTKFWPDIDSYVNTYLKINFPAVWKEARTYSIIVPLGRQL